MIDAQPTCPECDTLLPSGLGGGLCPRCLLVMATRSGSADAFPLELTDEQPERYDVIGEHAHGGMGRVLLVHDRVLGRAIAMKVLAEHSVSDADVLNDELTIRFLREARITGRLEHPSITPVHELGHRTDGSVYYTMKLVRGKTLAEAITERPLLRDRLALIPNLAAVCNAIAYAHSLGIIHRDIKPDNVMIGDFGETVVLDWGIAKVRDYDEFWSHDPSALEFLTRSDRGRTLPGFVMGTPAFMPPEQARGRNHEVDERSDVYALGAMLYTILTGRQPFDGASGTDILMQVLREEPVPVTAIERRAPRELAAICRKAMDKLPENRFQTAKELAEELARFGAREPVQSYHYSPAERALRVINRYRAASATALAGLVAVAAVLSVYSLRLSDTNADLETARNAEIEQRRRAEETNEALRWENYTATLQVAQSLVREDRLWEAEEALYRCPVELRDWEWGYLLRAARASALVHVTANDSTRELGSTYSSLMSPGDRYLLIDRTGTAVKTLHDLSTGDIVWQSPQYFGWRDCTLFSADGSLLVLGIAEDALGILTVPNGQLVRTFAWHGWQLRSTALSASNRYLAVLAVGPAFERQIVVFDAQTGEALHAVPTPQPADPPPRHTGEKAWWMARLDTPPGCVLGFSADESTLYYHDGSIVAMSLDTGSTERITGAASYAAAMTPDGSRLIVYQGEQRWDLWDLRSRRLVQSYVIDDPVRSRQGSTSLAQNDFLLTPDGASLLYTTDLNHYVLYDLVRGRTVFTSDRLPESLLRMSVSPSGRFMTTTSLSETNLWPLFTPRKSDYYPFRDGSELKTVRFPQGNGITHSARYAPDGLQLATPDDEGPFAVWNTRDYTQVFSSDIFGGEVRGVAFDGDQRVAAGAVNGMVAVFDRWTGEVLVQRQFEDGGKIVALEFTPDGEHLAVSHEYGREAIESGFVVNALNLYDAETLELVKPLWSGSYDQTVNLIRFTQSGKLLLGVDTIWHIGSHFEVRDAATGTLLDTIGDLTFTAHIDLNADESLALLSTAGADVVLYDLGEAREVWRSAALKAYVAVFHPDGKRFYAYSGSGFGLVASVDDGRELVQIDEAGPRAVFSADGTTLHTVPGQTAWFFTGYARAIRAYPPTIAGHADLERHQQRELAALIAEPR